MSTRRAAAHPRRGVLSQPAARRAGRNPLLLPSLLAVGAGLLAVVAFAAVTALSDPGVALRMPEPIDPSVPAEGRSLGAADAPVTIEIWSDFQCPACGRLAREIEPPLIRDHVAAGRVRLVYHDLAFLGEESVAAAAGSREAADQGRFWAFHDLVFANQEGENEGAFRVERLVAMARSAGLEVGAFERAMTDPAVRAAIARETAEGQALGIASTPTLVIDGRAYVGLPDYAALSALIEELAA